MSGVGGVIGVFSGRTTSCDGAPGVGIFIGDFTASVADATGVGVVRVIELFEVL